MTAEEKLQAAKRGDRCEETGKARFKSHFKAMLRAGEILRSAQGPTFLRAYECRHCGAWHLTSKPKNHFPKNLTNHDYDCKQTG